MTSHSKPNAIETTFFTVDNRTLWAVKRGEEIVKVGESSGDPSGYRAFDDARAWAEDNGIEVERWVHSKAARE